MRRILLGSLLAGAALLAPLALGTAGASATAPRAGLVAMAYAAWAPNTSYAVGARVTYSGKDYEAIQAHTSLVGWEPPNVPALWKPLSGTSTPTPTPTVSPTRTPTPTPTPTVSPTRTPTPTPTPTVTPTGPGGGKKVVGYFTNWGVYGRQYFVKNLVTSGSAAKLTHIIYAFGNVTNGRCVLSDTYADYDMAYTTANSVDGKADTWDAGVLRGNFGQLRKLKALYPKIKVLFSFGGWTYSGGFTQAAANPTAFADSCYNVVEDPRWADVFDGIDIDWEYPNACGLSCDSSGTAAYGNLMRALRARFGQNYLITSAITADGTGGGKIDVGGYDTAAQYVDWY
ncbi:glycosyl hydrolase family 18 protein, partial [Microbispora sp. ATCC PTA-5024]|uniref:glycosyl hydrolase family 18 protein n=1 Tax=Microbispora sp. ATCC PTA-5024 TaxID=316330 RepID=UPI0003DDB31A